MKVIINKILKEKAIKLVKDLGIGIYEIVLDIQLTFALCNSIEYVKSEDKIYIHIFEEDYDLVIDFEDLEEIDMLEILRVLKAI